MRANEIREALEKLQEEIRARRENRIKAKQAELRQQLAAASAALSDINVLFYYSSNAKNAALCEHDFVRFKESTKHMAHGSDLAFILHTPGGRINAAESIVRYMHYKFKSVTAIVPDFALSAGTIIALSCHKIIMSAIGQLSPTDPQSTAMGRNLPVKEVVLAHEEDGNCECRAHKLVEHLHAQSMSNYNWNFDLQLELIMMAGRSKTEASKMLDFFYKHPQKPHNHRIYYPDIIDPAFGLDVTVMQIDSALDKAVKNAFILLNDINVAFSALNRSSEFRTFFPFPAP